MHSQCNKIKWWLLNDTIISILRVRYANNIVLLFLSTAKGCHFIQVLYILQKKLKRTVIEFTGFSISASQAQVVDVNSLRAYLPYTVLIWRYCIHHYGVKASRRGRTKYTTKINTFWDMNRKLASTFERTARYI